MGADQRGHLRDSVQSRSLHRPCFYPASFSPASRTYNLAGVAGMGCFLPRRRIGRYEGCSRTYLYLGTSRGGPRGPCPSCMCYRLLYAYDVTRTCMGVRCHMLGDGLFPRGQSVYVCRLVISLALGMALPCVCTQYELSSPVAQEPAGP